MQVYFSPCGIGLGHVGRCIPIAKQLKDFGAKVYFSTYSEGLSFLKREKLPVVESPKIGFQVKPDGTIDFRLTTAYPGPFLALFKLIEQVRAEIKNIKSFKPDVVVSDSRISPIIASKLLGIPCICILNQFQIFIPRKKRFLKLARFSDMGSLALISKIWSSGIVLVPDFPPPYTICLGNLNIPKVYRDRVKLIGPILPIHPQKLPDKEELRKVLGLNSKYFIFAPISGPSNEKAYLIKILTHIFSRFPDDYQIIMSVGDPESSINSISYGNLKVYRWIELYRRYECLKASDLVISRAGHGTISQSIYYGKPMILIPTPSHTEQLNNAKRAFELGVAKVIKQGRISKQGLLRAVKEVLGNEGMVKKAESIKKDVLKIDGLKTAVKTILEVGKGGVENISA